MSDGRLAAALAPRPFADIPEREDFSALSGAVAQLAAAVQLAAGGKDATAVFLALMCKACGFGTTARQLAGRHAAAVEEVHVSQKVSS